MTQTTTYPVPENIKQRALINDEQYLAMYRESVEQPDAFWAKHGQRLDWIKPYTQVKDTSYELGKVRIKWFADGVLNASVNCLDRHLEKRGNQIAFYWEGDEPGVQKTVTYRELYEEVCQLANGMKALGVGKGDRVTIYLPMIPQAAVALLACARIGAVHSVVFAGFSPDALGSRIIDCDSKLVITTDQALRGSRATNLKDNTDIALGHLGESNPVKNVIVIKHVGKSIDFHPGRELERTTWNDRQFRDIQDQAHALPPPFLQEWPSRHWLWCDCETPPAAGPVPPAGVADPPPPPQFHRDLPSTRAQ